jgi:hypothetical protein
MVIDPPQIIAVSELQRLNEISQLNNAMFDNPHAIIHYIFSVREDLQKIEGVQKNIVRIRGWCQAIEGQITEKERKKK